MNANEIAKQRADVFQKLNRPNEATAAHIELAKIDVLFEIALQLAEMNEGRHNTFHFSRSAIPPLT